MQFTKELILTKHQKDPVLEAFQLGYKFLFSRDDGQGIERHEFTHVFKKNSKRREIKPDGTVILIDLNDH